MGAGVAPQTKPVSRFGIIGGTAAAVLLAGALFVEPWEGTELTPYRDIVGVLTDCTGHTGPDVIEGRRRTPEECKRILQQDLGKAYTKLAGCINRPVTVNQMTAILSLAFNVGAPRVCQSTLVRMLNEGQPPALWCKQLLRWDRAGGKVVRGLTRRRKAEYEVCITP